ADRFAAKPSRPTQAVVAAPVDERRFRAVFETALDAMLLVDDAGRFVDVNPAACVLLGYSRAELLMMRGWDVAPPARRAAVRRNWDGYVGRDSIAASF